MRRIAWWTAIAVVSLSLSNVGPPVFGAPSALIVSGELGSKIDEFLERLTAFGYSGAVVVAKGGEVILQKGYGYADRESARPVTPDTVFTIGSITKQFTGAAIVKLEMQGKLSVDDSITKYFDHVPVDKADITIHHLLTHTSGMVGGFGRDHDLKATREWLLDEVMKSKLKWKPGTRHRYSNVGYSLLGMIVEKASGMGYESYLQEHLFKPAGMNRTGYLIPDFQEDELAIGYRDGKRWGTVIQRPMIEGGPCWNLRANGGIHSTIRDMYRWHVALECDKVLSKNAKESYFAPHADEGSGDSFYGYGWVNFKTRRGTRLLAHNGGNSIFSADFRRYVDEGVVFYHCTNQSGFFVDPISEQIDRIIFGGKYDLPPKTARLDDTTLARYAGRYEVGEGGELALTAGDGTLNLTPRNQAACSAIAPPRGVGPGGVEALNQRTAEIVEKSHRGDYEPLHAAFGGRISLDRLAEMERDDWKEREAKSGPLQSVQVLGSGIGAGMVATTVELRFEKESQFLQYVWEGQSLAGARSASGPMTFSFTPISPKKFIDFKLGARHQSNIMFDIDPTGAVLGLTLRTRTTGRVTARKVE